MDIFKALNKLRWCIVFTSVLASVFFASALVSLSLIENKVASTVSAVGFSALFLFDLLLIAHFVSSYKQLFGQHLLKAVMASQFEGVTYDPDRALPRSLIEDTDMILVGNHYESSEYRTGLYRGIRFVMADVDLQNVIHHGKRRASVTYFSGSWMIFDFDKSFTIPLQVKEKSFLNAQKPKANAPNLDRVIVGNESLERFFKVYAEEESAAREFLNEALSEAILRLNYELKGDLMFYFSGNRLHIALHGKRAQYEPMLLGKLYREEVERVLLTDCRAVSTFLDRLLAIETIFENGTTVTEG